MKNDAVQDFLTERWNEFRHAIKERWPDITDNELDVINGQSDVLVGTLQEHYWISKAEAEKQLRDFVEEFLGEPAL